MSVIMAVDTSSDACSVALLRDQKVSELHTITPRQHTQKLLPMIDELLSQEQCQLKDLSAIAYGRGPGSFTGLRICMGTVQGLAYAAEIPLVPVSTLEALAVGAQRQQQYPESSCLLVALDARMNEVYWAAYEICQGQPKAITDEYVMAPEKVIAHPVFSSGRAISGVGAGWHYTALQLLKPLSVLSDINPAAIDIIPLAEQSLSEGKAVKAEEARPIYLRDSVAWEKRKRIRDQ